MKASLLTMNGHLYIAVKFWNSTESPSLSISMIDTVHGGIVMILD